MTSVHLLQTLATTYPVPCSVLLLLLYVYVYFLSILPQLLIRFFSRRQMLLFFLNYCHRGLRLSFSPRLQSNLFCTLLVLVLLPLHDLISCVCRSLNITTIFTHMSQMKGLKVKKQGQYCVTLMM